MSKNQTGHCILGRPSVCCRPDRSPQRNDSVPLHLTRRDQYANTLEDMFDFDRSPSLNTPVGKAEPPAHDCTP